MQQPSYHYTQKTPNQDCLSRRVTSLFVKVLLDYEIPNTAKLVNIKTYNGTTDLDSHTDTYEWTMTSLKLDERFWCTYFPSTFDGDVGMWLKTHRPGSIYTFSQLKYLFLTNFMQLRKYKGDSHSIIRCKQREGETVKEYFTQFANATLDVPGHDEGPIAGEFTWGLLHGTLSHNLMGKKPQTRAQIKGEGGEALKCYKIMQPKEISKESKRPRLEGLEGNEVINWDHPDQPICIGVTLPLKTRQAFIELLNKYKHVFSWTPTGMVGVDRGVIEHKLMIRPGTKEGRKRTVLGYYITKEGIQPSPTKITELKEVTSPHTLWYAQETLGHLAKWAIELGEHDINYHPRTSIKRRALAEFFTGNTRRTAKANGREHAWEAITRGRREEDRKLTQKLLHQTNIQGKQQAPRRLEASGKQTLHEAHAGPAGAHEGSRSVTGKILRMNLYWLDIYEDVTKLTRTCAKCQHFSPVQGVPPEPLTSIISR
uniref:Retrotransposon gag domain-containing protein n=1 Tax=Lactuca sativa TaxID=4236 RepID=A0A9R1WJC6_LACSA|nr:hypothetical protein LSAT_V11C100018890 [Lactuca sativa]